MFDPVNISGRRWSTGNYKGEPQCPAELSKSSKHGISKTFIVVWRKEPAHDLNRQDCPISKLPKIPDLFFSSRPRLSAYLLYFGAALAAAINFQYWNGGYSVDLGLTGDEAAHFVNTLVIRDYLTQAFGSNPIDFAKQYYEHLPRVSIGHWPPFFYLVQALLVALWDRSVQAAIFFQAVILAALSACAGGIAAQRYGIIAGGAVALALLLAPTPLYSVNTVMIDNFMALLVLLAALAWARYAESPGPLGAVIFAVTASATILTKGNGFALALLPPFHAALSGKWRLLIRGWTWLAAGIVGVLTLPWTLLTMRFVADGFKFKLGLAYSGLALEQYGAELGPTFGYAVLAAFAIGAVSIVRDNWRGMQRRQSDHIETALLAAALAVMMFQLIAPADISPRYLIPLIAPVLIIAVRGTDAVGGLFHMSGKLAVALSICIVLALGAAETFRVPRAGSHLMDRVAETIIASRDTNPLVLVAASPNGEGALIAEFAARDPGRGKYIIRGTKYLATADFMGADYRVRYTTPDEVANAIARYHFGWVVIELGSESQAWPHVSQVIRATSLQPTWVQTGLYRRDGREVVLYRILGPAPSAEDIKQIIGIVALDKKLSGN